MTEPVIGLQIVIDCPDPAALAPFWAAALGYQLQEPPAGFDTWPAFLASIGVPEQDWNSASAVVDPAGIRPRLFLQQVPEAKVVKNRVHLDLKVTDRTLGEEDRDRRLAAETDRLTALGAQVLNEVRQHGEHWIVLADPVGNEFCIS
jgi:hypothetical protein